MIWRLALKELSQHLRIAAGLAVATLALYVSVYQFMVRDEAPTLLRAATACTWGAGPILAVFTARRLFVFEHEQGTVHLLRALPLSPTTTLLTKFGVGLLVNVALNLVLLWGTAVLRQPAEIIPFDWVLRLSVQVSVYVFAWFSIATLLAQFGGYRYGLWLVLLSTLVGLDEVVHEPSRNLFWTAPLAEALEATRYRTPWDAVGLGLAWGVGALSGAIALARHRGGSLVDAWFEPMSARTKAQVTGAVFVALLLLQVFASEGSQQMRLTDVPSVGRIAVGDPALEPLAARTSATLRRLESEYGLPEMPRALLRLRWDDRPEALLYVPLGDDELLLMARPDAPPAELDRVVLTDLLNGHAGGLLEEVPAAGIWALGFAPFVLEDETLGATAARLTDLPATALEDHLEITAGFGRRGAEAAGWIAWRAAAELGGAEAVRALADDLFGPRRSRTGGGLIRARRLRPRDVLEDHGVAWADLVARWQAEIRGRAARAPAVAAPPLPQLALQARPGATHHLTWSGLPTEALAQPLQIWWSVAEDLAPRPVPAEARVVTTVTSTAGAAPVWADPRRRIVATWVVDGEVQGWAEVSR